MTYIDNKCLTNLDNISNHLFSDFDLKITHFKSTKSLKTFNGRLLSHYCKIYLNSHVHYILESSALILNDNGNFIVNPKITNKNLTDILDKLIINIKFMECFIYRQSNKEIYPNIFVSLYFDNDYSIKSYKMNFISAKKKQVLLFTRNKQVTFSTYNIEYLEFNKHFEEETVFSTLKKDKYTSILNKEWSDLVLSTNNLDYFNNVKNLNNILMY